MEVYYYIPENEKTDALSCGIKLSVKTDKKVPINSRPTSCISTLLNPKDDLEKYNSPLFACLKFELKPQYCFIADRALYGCDNTAELYAKSIISPDCYNFGIYRFPECLITCTILPDNISLASKIIGTPILYNSSEELYLNRLIAELREKHENFDDAILSLYFDSLVTKDKLVKIENSNLTIYTSTDGEVYTAKKGMV